MAKRQRHSVSKSVSNFVHLIFSGVGFINSLLAIVKYEVIGFSQNLIKLLMLAFIAAFLVLSVWACLLALLGLFLISLHWSLMATVLIIFLLNIVLLLITFIAIIFVKNDLKITIHPSS